MPQNRQEDFEGTLIEPQGVNAGDAIDALVTLTPHQYLSDGPLAPPTPYELSKLRPHELVGVPEDFLAMAG